jgi:uncharacterized protein YprB with RNaseH-like and TPR domain
MIPSVVYDIETTDLKALFGHILCCSFYDGLTGEVTTFRLDEKPYRGRSKIDDGKLAVAIRDHLEKYKLIVGHNSKMFDLPFINARLARIGERPVEVGWHMDTRWYLNSTSMRIGSAKLDNAQKFFKLDDEKTPISWETWALAGTLDREAMDEVVVHCEQDVKVLAELVPHVLPYVKNLHR